MENHCEIHAPLNPEWPLLVKCSSELWLKVSCSRVGKEVGGWVDIEVGLELNDLK